MCDIVKGVSNPWLHCLLEVKLHEKDGPMQSYVYTCGDGPPVGVLAYESQFSKQIRAHQAQQCFPESILISPDSDSLFMYHYQPKVSRADGPQTPYFPIHAPVNEESQFCYVLYTSRSDQRASRGHVLTSYVLCSTVYLPNVFLPLASAVGRLCGVYSCATVMPRFAEQLSTYKSLTEDMLVFYRVSDWSLQLHAPMLYTIPYSQYDEQCLYANVMPLKCSIPAAQPMCLDVALGPSLIGHVYSLWSLLMLREPLSLAFPFLNGNTFLFAALSTLTFPIPPPAYLQPCLTTHAPQHDHSKGGQLAFRNSILTKLHTLQSVLQPSSSDKEYPVDSWTCLLTREGTLKRQTKFLETELSEMFPSMYPVFSQGNTSGGANVEIEKVAQKRANIVNKYLDKCDQTNKDGCQIPSTPKPSILLSQRIPGMLPKVSGSKVRAIEDLSVHITQVTATFLGGLTRFMNPPPELLAFPIPTYRQPDQPGFMLEDQYDAVVGSGLCVQQGKMTNISTRRWNLFTDAFLCSSAGKEWFEALKKFIIECSVRACEIGLLALTEEAVVMELADACEVTVLERAIRKGREQEHQISAQCVDVLKMHLRVYRRAQELSQTKKWSVCREDSFRPAVRRQIEENADWESYTVETMCVPGNTWAQQPKEQPSPDTPSQTVRHSLANAWTQIQGHFDEAFK